MMIMLFCALGLASVGQTKVSGHWEPVPLVAAEHRKPGQIGGEGAQWPRSLAVDSTGKTVLLGIDVGGIYRSLDAGNRWEPANVGYSPRGAAAIAFDPNNPLRVIAIGGNTSLGGHHGIYLSTNRGGSWRNVLPLSMAGIGEIREQIAFDPTSYAAGARKTMRVFWSRVKGDTAGWGKPEEHPAIYRSEDGGDTWQELPNTAALGGSILRCLPESGWLIAGNSTGLYVSKDKGKSFEQQTKDQVTGLDVSPKDPTSIWMTTPTEVLRSEDRGKTWRPLNSRELALTGHILRNIKVSPVNSDRMVLWRDQEPNAWDWRRYYSDDGGQTWRQSKIEVPQAFLPSNTRQGIFAWSPADEKVLFSIGGDLATKSTDGGATFKWSNQGNNGVLVGGKFNFNLQNPDVMFFGSQDYNGAITKDRGKTWTYLNPSGNGWGGFCYGGYAASAQTLVVGNAAGWGAPRKLKTSFDGGKTWQEQPHQFDGEDASFGDPRRPEVIFASNLRSEDGGKTWAKMDGCSGVITASAAHDGRLFGISRGAKAAVVVSTDSGKTWREVASFEGEIRDIAYDHVGDRLYAVLNELPYVLVNGAWVALEIPKNQFGWYDVRGIAVDPRKPETVVIASAGNIHASSTAVMISRDSGKTWTNLTRQKAIDPDRLDEKQLDGGREAFCVRIHPKTGEIWVATSCYGIWKWVPNG